MNIVLFASDHKGVSVLINIAHEIKKRDHNYFFLFSEENQLQYPTQSLDNFYYDTNCENSISTIFSKTLNCSLPFIPDVIVLQRERWQPEQNIIAEFKHTFKSKAYVVEVSSHIMNNIENRLEMISRTKYPQNMVDGFFEHSEFAKQRRIDCIDDMWGNKSIVVGNPRFDKLTNIDEDICIDKYNIDKNKKQILFWGIQNTTRKLAIELLDKLSNFNKDKFQVFYKCYPGEPFNDRFKHQFYPFVIPDVTVIYDNLDVNTMSKLCDFHIGAITSVYNYGFYFNKNVINLNNVIDVQKHMNDIDVYIKEPCNGIEDSAKFWMDIYNLKDIDEFKSFIDISKLEKFKETNDYVMELTKKSINNFDIDFKFLNSKSKNNKSFIKLFDEFGDNKASERILNYLENVI